MAVTVSSSAVTALAYAGKQGDFRRRDARAGNVIRHARRAAEQPDRSVDGEISKVGRVVLQRIQDGTVHRFQRRFTRVEDRQHHPGERAEGGIVLGELRGI